MHPVTTPLSALLGEPGQDPECRVVSPAVAVHWWASWPQPGDLCLCGTLPYVPPLEHPQQDDDNDATAPGP